VRGVFVDANESLAVIFERLEKPGDPKVRVHRDPDITPDQYPKILDGAEIAIVDHTALPTDIAKKCAGLKHVVFLGTGARSYMNPEELAELWTDDHREDFAKAGTSSHRIFEATLREYAPKELLDRLMYLDLHHYLPDDLMVKMDIASMANSLETRSPFLDHVLAEEVARWPVSWKYRPLNHSKRILKETFAKDLPPQVLYRGKQGFGVPLSQWFRGPLKSYLREIILSPEALARGYFRPDVVTRYVDDHQSGRRDRSYGLWALLMLELWHQESFRP